MRCLLIYAVFILQENVGLMLLWYITFLVVDFMLSGIGVLLEYLVPASSMDVVKSMIQMFLRLFMILVEADYIVNLMEGYCKRNSIPEMKKNIFKTETGKYLLEQMFEKSAR